MKQMLSSTSMPVTSRSMSEFHAALTSSSWFPSPNMTNVSVSLKLLRMSFSYLTVTTLSAPSVTSYEYMPA